MFTCHSTLIYPPPIPVKVNSDVNFEDSPKLMKLTSFADNIYPYIGFVPVSPTLSRMLMCLHDVNPSSSRFPFTSVQHGN